MVHKSPSSPLKRDRNNIIVEKKRILAILFSPFFCHENFLGGNLPSTGKITVMGAKLLLTSANFAFSDKLVTREDQIYLGLSGPVSHGHLKYKPFRLK